MISILVESAMRSLVLAGLVWAGLRVFGVRNVVAQKASWGVVLGLALAMPMLLPVADSWQMLPKQEGIVLPANPQTLLEELQAKIQAKRAPAHPAAEAAVPTEAPADSLQNASAPKTDLSASELNPPQEEDSSEPLPHSASSPDGLAGSGHGADALTSTEEPASPRPAISATGLAILIYFAVAVAFFGRLFYGLVAALRLWNSAKPIAADSIASRLDPQSEWGSRVRSSRKVASPVTIGSGIVLPADYAAWDSEKLRIVLAHERSHVRQGDFYLQLLAGSYAAMFWVSPLGWWIKRRLSELGEAISDRAGLEQAGSRSSYAQLLLEFAAAPRPTALGVAMARSSNVSRRIEQLLNDRTFHQAFAGGRRALAAVLLAPMAFLVATALVRVEAAGQTQQPAPDQQAQPTPAAQPAPAEGVSNPEPVSNTQEGPQAPTPDTAPYAVPAPAAAPTPAAPPSPAAPPAPPASGEVVVPQGASAVPAAPPAPSAAPKAPEDVHVPPVDVHVPETHVHIPATDIHVPAKDIHVPAVNVYAPATDVHIPAIDMHMPAMNFSAHLGDPWFVGPDGKAVQDAYGYHFSWDGDPYALVHKNGKDMQFSGDWAEGQRETIEKARQQAHGDFLWFTHDGKSYLVDDPAVIARIKALYVPMEVLGKQQEALGRKQEALGKQQEELGRQQEQVSIPAPEMKKEMNELRAAMAKLEAEMGRDVTRQDLANLQGELGSLQGRLGALQGEMGARQGDFGAKMGELGREQGELGAQQGRLGAEQGRLAREADRQVKSIIDESLHSGKAHPID